MRSQGIVYITQIYYNNNSSLCKNNMNPNPLNPEETCEVIKELSENGYRLLDEIPTIEESEMKTEDGTIVEITFPDSELILSILWS